MRTKLMKGFLIITMIVGVCNPLFSQWNDNFSDNEFTNNPEWQGNIAIFVVDGENLRLNAPAVAGNSYLVTNSDISLEAEWNFFIKLDFNPSSSNYIKIFLMADSINLNNIQNGYFVKIGGSDDEVSLYKVANGFETKLIDGIDDRVDLSVVEVFVQITRAENGEWDLQTKLEGESNFISEGFINDLEIQKSSYFGIFCKYTSTRSTKFYVDDISVTGNPYVDPDPPILVSVSTPQAKQIKLIFDEALDTLEAVKSTHYTLNDSIGTVTVTAIAIDTLILEFENEFELINELKIEFLPDLAGNTLDTVVQVVFVDAAPFTYRDLVINEIFPDPNPQEDLPPFEFIELFNNSARIIDVDGWQFTDGSKVGILQHYLIYPDSFLIICSNEAVTDFMQYGSTVGLRNWPALNNGGDNLKLIDSSGNTIDSLSYTLDWYNDGLKDNGGWSLEQINPNASCIGNCNWAASIEPGGGTPGIINSVFDLGFDEAPPKLLAVSNPNSHQLIIAFDEAIDSLEALNNVHFSLNDSLVAINITSIDVATLLLEFTQSLDPLNSIEIIGLPDLAGNMLDTVALFYYIDPTPHSYRDIVINEIFADPNPQEDLPLFEFVELLNISDKVINLSGWQFTDGSKVLTFQNQLIYPDSFLIICSQEAVEDYEQFGATIGIVNWPTLNNGGDSLRLTDKTDASIDSVTYTADWYNSNFKNDGGWSLEQINPKSNCLGICNWAASVDPMGGTPGLKNSIFDLGLDEAAPELMSVSTPANNQIKLVFSEALDSINSINTDKYELNHSTHPTNVSVLTNDTILLEFAGFLSLSNTLEIIALEDTVGNSLDTLVNMFFIDPSPHQYRNVVINEIFADPNPQEDLPLFEFVELLNISDRIIDLTDWQFSDGSKSSSFSSQLLFPDSILIICSTDAEEAYEQFGKTIGLVNWPTLNNGGDPLILISKSGEVIDSLDYKQEWYKNNTKDDGGWSLEQINPLSKCLGFFNWEASISLTGGTPGKTNSVYSINTDFDLPQITQALVTDSLVEVWFSEPIAPNTYLGSIFPFELNIIFEVNASSKYSSSQLVKNLSIANSYTIEIPLEDCNGNKGISYSIIIPIDHPNNGDIIINEILFNPFSGGSDFVEFVNTTTKYFNLKSYFINNETDSSLISDTTLLLPPNNYLAISEDILFLKNQYLAPDSSLFETDLPTMPNDEGIIIIKSKSGETIDSVFYSDTYHFSLIADVEGISLERISRLGESNNKDNWRSAAKTNGYATPGYENSQSIEPSSEGSVTVSPEVITTNNDGQADFCQINFALGNHSQTISISVYNINGQLVNTITNNAIIPPSGFFTWDGTNQQGGVLPTAHYIIVSEVMSSDGRTQRFRNKVVVANGF